MALLEGEPFRRDAPTLPAAFILPPIRLWDKPSERETTLYRHARGWANNSKHPQKAERDPRTVLSPRQQRDLISRHYHENLQIPEPKRTASK